MPARVTTDDLAFAAVWLETYDGAEDDQNNAAAARVAAWLRAEMARREEDATVRYMVTLTGATPARVRAELRKQAT